MHKLYKVPFLPKVVKLPLKKFHLIFLGEIVFEAYSLLQALTGIFYSRKGWSA